MQRVTAFDLMQFPCSAYEQPCRPIIRGCQRYCYACIGGRNDHATDADAHFDANQGWLRVRVRLHLGRAMWNVRRPLFQSEVDIWYHRHGQELRLEK